MNIIVIFLSASAIIGLIAYIARTLSKVYLVHKVCGNEHLSDKEVMYLTKMMGENDHKILRS